MIRHNFEIYGTPKALWKCLNYTSFHKEIKKEEQPNGNHSILLLVPPSSLINPTLGQLLLHHTDCFLQRTSSVAAAAMVLCMQTSGKLLFGSSSHPRLGSNYSDKGIWNFPPPPLPTFGGSFFRSISSSLRLSLHFHYTLGSFSSPSAGVSQRGTEWQQQQQQRILLSSAIPRVFNRS